MALAVAFALASGASASNVGVTSAVLPQATGTPPAEQSRVLQVGLDMFADERVQTGPQGKAQLLFLDGTALSVGPNSDLVLDEFVYDADARAGKLAMSATRGLLRVVGGRISKQAPITVRTPAATIGIRGGIALISVGPERVSASFLFGSELTVTTAGGTMRTVTRPGTEATIDATGEVTLAPVGDAALAESLGSLEGEPQQQVDGVPQVSESDVAGSQISSLGSGTAPQVQGAPGAALPTGASSGSTEPTVARDATREAGRQTPVADLPPPEDPEGPGEPEVPEVPEVPPPPPPQYGGRYLSQVPFLPASFDFDTLFTTPDPARAIGYSGGTVEGDVFTAALGGQAIRLPAGQTGSFIFTDADTASPFGPVSGRAFIADDRSFFYYDLRETAQGGNPASLFAGLPSTAVEPDRFRAFRKMPGFPGDSQIPFLPAAFGGTQLAAGDLPLTYWALRDPETQPSPDARSQTAWAAVLVQGSGGSQISAGLASTSTFFMPAGTDNIVASGFQRGSVRLAAGNEAMRVDGGNATAQDADGNAFFGSPNADHYVEDADFFSEDGATRLSAAAFAQPFEDTAQSNEFYRTAVNVRADLPQGVGERRSTRTLHGYAAGMLATRTFPNNVQSFDSRAVFAESGGTPGADDQATGIGIRTNAATNRVDADFRVARINQPASHLVFRWGSQTGTARGAFVDDDIFVMRDKADPAVPSTVDFNGTAQVATLAGGVVSSVFFADRSAVPANVIFCDCNASEWGFWFADIRDVDGGDGFFPRARLHLATWVAGVLPDLPSINALAGTARYDGHAVVNVFDNGAEYLAFGNATLNWSFASDTGTLLLPGLDGHDYFANVRTLNGRDLTGTLTGVDGAFSGQFEGSFFAGAGNPAAELGGQIEARAADGDDYRWAGILQARGTTVALPAPETLGLRYGGLYVSREPVVPVLGTQTSQLMYDPARYRPYKHATLGANTLTIALGADSIRLPVQTGSFSFNTAAAGGTLSPFGPVSGEGFVAADRSFFYYRLNEASFNANPAAFFGGVAASGSPRDTRAYDYLAGFPGDSNIPHLRPGFGGDLPYVAPRPLIWTFSDVAPARQAWGAVVIDGTGPSQRSAMVGSVASSFFDATTANAIFSGFVRGYVRPGATGAIVETTDGNSVVPDANGLWAFGRNGIGAEHYVVDSDFYETGGAVRIPGQAGAFLLDAQSPPPRYQQQVARRTTLPAGVGASRQTRMLQGYAGGLAESQDLSTFMIGTEGFGNANDLPGDVTIFTDAASNHVFARFDLRGETGGPGERVELFFGTPPAGGNASRSSFVDDRIFVMRRAQGGNIQPSGQPVPGDGARYDGGIDGRLRGIVLTDYFFANRSAVPGNVALCACEFLSWGFWGADVVPLAPGAGPDRLRMQLAGYVAGELPALIDIPAGGVATYNGHAMANVRDSGGHNYTAFGNYQQQWNFGTRSGMVTISDLDGATYTGNAASANGREISAALSGPGSRTGGYNASFLRAPGNPVGGIGGNFSLTGLDGYQAAGVVVGRQ